MDGYGEASDVSRAPSSIAHRKIDHLTAHICYAAHWFFAAKYCGARPRWRESYWIALVYGSIIDTKRAKYSQGIIRKQG